MTGWAAESGDAGIGHFCHTPWAPPDYFRMLPDDVGRALLDGILGADQAGFHAERWATAFLDCCTAVLGADVSRTRLAGPGPGPVGRVTYRGQAIEVAVHPLGVDAAALPIGPAPGTSGRTPARCAGPRGSEADRPAGPDRTVQ